MCARLAREFNYAHISVGELFRQEAEKESSLGDEIAEAMKEGELVPVGITLSLIRKAMEANDNQRGFLLEGFPRKMDQALEFEAKVNKN